MAATHIATTPRGRFNALRHQGILITDSWAQISSMLEKSLSKRHALLLAEPVHEASGSSTDWYTEATGSPVALNALPDEEQRKARQEFASLASDIGKLAQELKDDPNPTRSIRGHILALALRYPGEDQLFMVGDQPVVTCWGFEPGTLGAQPEDLIRLGAAAPVAAATARPAPEVAPPPPAAVATGFAWWRGLLAFLLGLLLLVALFYLAGMLFGPAAGCALPGAATGGCAPPPAPGGCAPAPAVVEKEKTPEVNKELVTELTAEQEKERTLRGQLEDLRRQLAERAALCVPPKKEEPREEAKLPEPPKEEPKVEPKVEEEPPSLADFLPTTPEPPKEEPKPEPAPKQEKPKPQQPKRQARGEDMSIPDDARKNNDVSFLEGCWNSETGLVSTSGEPVVVQYCFDANGRGTRSINRQRSGDRCAGSLRAKFDSRGNLVIDADAAPCPRGGGFVPHKVQCTPRSDGKTNCKGQEQGRRNTWDARFRRS